MFKGSCPAVPENMHVKFKICSFNQSFLELLAFNAQKFRGSRDPSHAPFRKTFKGSCLDCPWKHARKFEVRSFNRFKLVSLTGLLSAHTHDRQTDRQTHIE